MAGWLAIMAGWLAIRLQVVVVSLWLIWLVCGGVVVFTGSLHLVNIVS